MLSNTPIGVGFLELLVFLIRGLMVSFTIKLVIFLGSMMSSMSSWFVDAWKMRVEYLCT